MSTSFSLRFIHVLSVFPLRLEETLKSTQQESASALQRRLEIEKTLIDANYDVRVKTDRIAELSDQLRVAQVRGIITH